MPDNAWIFVAYREAWPECVSMGSFGLQTKPGLIGPAKVGDPCLAYVTRESAFAGFGKITRPYYYDESGFSDGLFPHRLGIEMKLDLDRTVSIRPLINDLGFIKDKRYWSVFLQSGAVRIPRSDFELIKSKLEERWKTEEPPPPPPESENLREIILNLPDLDATSLHDRLAEMIALVGQEMGYDPVQRFKTHPESPYQIDVAWLQKESPHIAVEVHDGGNLVEALERLRHARDFNFRKVIIVIVDPKDLKRCLDILRFDDKLKHWIDLWSVKSVYDMYTSCMAFQVLYRRFEESTYKEHMQDQLL